jgi:hypothetical protein
MGWDALPLELEEQILSNLSLAELALLSSTRKVFLAPFRKELAEQQKALCEEAYELFGDECLKRLADLCRCFLTGDTIQMTRLGGIRFMFLGKSGSDGLRIRLYGSSGLIWPMRILNEERWQISFDPVLGRTGCSWVPVVQVLLSGVPLPFLDGQTVRIRFSCLQPPLTLVEVKAQIAPLLPLVAHCTCEGVGLGGSITIKERRQAGQVGSGANQGITLFIDCTQCVGYKSKA